MDRSARRHRRFRAASLAALAVLCTLPAPAAVAQTAPDAGPVAKAPDDPATVRPVKRTRATVAGIIAPVVARGAPSARARVVWRVPSETDWSRQPQALLVLDSSLDRTGRRWLKLELPIRPNSASGWIPDDYAVLATTRYWIDVSTARRTVTVFHDGRAARRLRAVVGTRATPTPKGLFAVWEINPQPDPKGFLGPWSLPITALSDVLDNYGGGPGRVAIHGRDGLSLRDPLGSASSHGCIRVDDRDILWLAHHVPRGTPVEIR